jgi:hypothetical protein
MWDGRFISHIGSNLQIKNYPEMVQSLPIYCHTREACPRPDRGAGIQKGLGDKLE